MRRPAPQKHATNGMKTSRTRISADAEGPESFGPCVAIAATWWTLWLVDVSANFGVSAKAASLPGS